MSFSCCLYIFSPALLTWYSLLLTIFNQVLHCCSYVLLFLLSVLVTFHVTYLLVLWCGRLKYSVLRHLKTISFLFFLCRRYEQLCVSLFCMELAYCFLNILWRVCSQILLCFSTRVDAIILFVISSTDLSTQSQNILACLSFHPICVPSLVYFSLGLSFLLWMLVSASPRFSNKTKTSAIFLIT